MTRFARGYVRCIQCVIGDDLEKSLYERKTLLGRWADGQDAELPDEFWHRHPRFSRDRRVRRKFATKWADARLICPKGHDMPEEFLETGVQYAVISVVGPPGSTKTHFLRWFKASLEGSPGVGTDGSSAAKGLRNIDWQGQLWDGQRDEWLRVMKTQHPGVETNEDQNLDATTETRPPWVFVLKRLDKRRIVQPHRPPFIVIVPDPEGATLLKGSTMTSLASCLVLLVPPSSLGDPQRTSDPASAPSIGPSVEDSIKVARTQLNNWLGDHRARSVVFVACKSDMYQDVTHFPAEARQQRDLSSGLESVGEAIANDSVILTQWLSSVPDNRVFEYVRGRVLAEPGAKLYVSAVGGLGPENPGQSYDPGHAARCLDALLVTLGKFDLSRTAPEPEKVPGNA